MHTYQYNDKKRCWDVGRLERNRVGEAEIDDFVVVRSFSGEMDAICFVNVLNGGSCETHVIDVIVALFKKVVP